MQDCEQLIALDPAEIELRAACDLAPQGTSPNRVADERHGPVGKPATLDGLALQHADVAMTRIALDALERSLDRRAGPFGVEHAVQLINKKKIRTSRLVSNGAATALVPD